MFQKKKKEKSQLGSDISGIMCSTLTVTCCNSDLQILEKKMMMYHVPPYIYIFYFAIFCNWGHVMRHVILILIVVMLFLGS